MTEPFLSFRIADYSWAQPIAISGGCHEGEVLRSIGCLFYRIAALSTRPESWKDSSPTAGVLPTGRAVRRPECGLPIFLGLLTCLSLAARKSSSWPPSTMVDLSTEFAGITAEESGNHCQRNLWLWRRVS
mgnify:CR=1 FL=1